jgi:uncharacterized protein YecE (DUF72 family)
MYDDWRGRLYPQREPRRRWLELYAQHFDTVEVNNTFYRLARREAVQGWVRQTPPEFLFSVKASRYLTHIKRLAAIEEGIQRFYEPLEPMLEAQKLGPVLWQLPENFHRDDARLEGWLELIDSSPSALHTIEFRHASWFAPEVMATLHAHGVALTIGDHPERPFQTLDPTAGWSFIRFHYGARGRHGNYSDREIDGWAQQISAWPQTQDVYAYFNNDWNGYAPANARTLIRRLQSVGRTESSTGRPNRSRTSSRSRSSR